MATWEDGPEYAPLERPADFAMPSGAALEHAPAVAPPLAAQAPKTRPLFADPAVPVAPVASLVPAVLDPRDPQLPFEVAAATMTSESAWGALQPSPAAPPPGPDPMEPAGPMSWPAPEEPLQPRVPDAVTSGYPAPGTPDWFGPSPYEPVPPPTPVNLRAVLTAATPGLCICLVIGGLIFVLAPIMLGVAFGLSSRVSVARPAVRRVFTTVLATVGLIAVVTALGNQTGFADWWDLVGSWSLFFCWVLLAVTLGLVFRGMKQPHRPAPPSSTWG